jgi:hypothetical protein
VSEKYREVKKLKFRVDITPSSEIGNWKLCSHSGICSEHHPDRNPKVMKVRWIVPILSWLPNAISVSAQRFHVNLTMVFIVENSLH